jgi:hypothetical protein
MAGPFLLYLALGCSSVDDGDAMVWLEREVKKAGRGQF